MLKFDEYITKEFVTWANQLLPLQTLKTHYKAIEVSIHYLTSYGLTTKAKTEMIVEFLDN